MDSSDPLLSSSWFTKTNRMPLPAEDVDLLDSPIISPGVGHKGEVHPKTRAQKTQMKKMATKNVSELLVIKNF